VTLIWIQVLSDCELGALTTELSRSPALSLSRSPALSLSRSLAIPLSRSLALSLSRSLALSLSRSLALSLSRYPALSLSRYPTFPLYLLSLFIFVDMSPPSITAQASKTGEPEDSNIFLEFASDTSAHGIGKIAKAKSKSKKIFWASLVVIAILSTVTFLSIR